MWVRLISSLVIAPSNPCKLRHRSRWALLLAVLMGSSPAFADGTPSEAALEQAPDLRIQTKVGEAFTTAQINTVLRLIERAKQRIDPEYYLSETYLHEAALETAYAKRRRNRQMMWRQEALEKQRLRQERGAERIAERERFEQIRSQERNITRIQRKAQLYNHRRQHCLRLKRRAEWRRQNNPRYDLPFSHRSHPSCS